MKPPELNLESAVREACRMIACMTTLCRALRVVRGYRTWPPGHPESPTKPEAVRAFEAMHDIDPGPG